MTQNPPEQPQGQQGPFGAPGQYAGGAFQQPPYGQSDPSGQPGQYGQPDQYGAAPQPGYGTSQGGPVYGSGQQPSGAAGTDGNRPAEPASPLGPPPGGGRPRSNGPVIAGIVIGGLVVLALLLWGAIALIDGRDDTIPAPTPTATDPAEEPSDQQSDGGASGEPSDQPSGQGSDDPADAEHGELYDLLTTEAAQVDGSDGTWTVQGEWTDASDLSTDAMEAYTAGYTSDTGELTLTALSFPDLDAADSYIAGVKSERGDPDSEGQVWQQDNGNGLGTRISYAGDGSHSIYWYDDTAVVYQVDAADQATASDFYGSLSF